MAGEILTPQSERWEEFVKRLQGPEGCDFVQEKDGPTWLCEGGDDKTFATKILRSMGGIDVQATLKRCHEYGGHCDCEILFNVEK